jgi:hypothetical protein
MSQSNKTGCLVPLLIAVPFALMFSGYYFSDIHGVQTFLPGDEASYNPIQHYDSAAALAGDVDLFRMDARFVSSDGTMDLTAAYDPMVRYQFFGGATKSDDRPIGAGGGGARTHFVTIEVTDSGFRHTGSDPDGSQYYDLNLGMRKREHDGSAGRVGVEPLSPPKCSFATLWEHAVDGGAPSNAVATITYDFRGYHFRIEDTEYRWDFDKDCRPLD